MHTSVFGLLNLPLGQHSELNSKVVTKSTLTGYASEGLSIIIVKPGLIFLMATVQPLTLYAPEYEQFLRTLCTNVSIHSRTFDVSRKPFSSTKLLSFLK